MHFVRSPSREFPKRAEPSSLPEGRREKPLAGPARDFIATKGSGTAERPNLCGWTVNETALEEEHIRQLLCQVAEGNVVAFWMLWDMYKGHLYHLCLWHMGGIQEDAEDALSRAMLRALEKLPHNVCKIENFKAWLSKLTLNLCIDIHRERRRQMRRLESIEDSFLGANDRAPVSKDSLEERLISREVFAHVCNAVDGLPPRLREPFVLRFFQEMEYREIAECLILSPANVRKRIQQARDILRQELNSFLQGTAMVQRQSEAWATSPRLALD